MTLEKQVIDFTGEMSLNEFVEKVTESMFAMGSSHCGFVFKAKDSTGTEKYELRFEVDLIPITN